MKKMQLTGLSAGATLQRKVTLKFRTGLFLFGVFCVLLLSYGFATPAVSRGEGHQEFLAVALADEGASPESSADGNVAEDAQPDADPAGGNTEAKQKRLIAKLLPDVKVLIETPTTCINLDGVFDATEVAGDGKAIVYEVLHNTKKKVAKATIDLPFRGSAFHFL